MSKILYHTKFLELKSTISKNGSEWVYAHRPNAKDVVVILPVTEDEVMFIIEERPPIKSEKKGKYTIGLAAGLVGDERGSETLEDAIKAELLEETGLISDNIEIKTQKIASSAGCTSETFAVAIAYIKNKTPIQKPISDNGVIIDRIWVKKENVHSWLKKMEKENNIITAQVLTALFYMNT